MELLKELITIRERQAESDCIGFTSEKTGMFLKFCEERKEKNLSNCGLSNLFSYGAMF